MVIIWLIIALSFLLLEMASPGLFYFLSFFFGALIAAGTDIFFVEPVIPIISFFIGSFVSFLLLSMWVKKGDKYIHKTNVYALQGKHGVVIHTIDSYNRGSVKVNGEMWSAIAEHDVTVAPGEQVEVVRVQGAYLIVKKRS